MNVLDLKGKTVAFASSGGLDSCTVTRWLVEHDVNVISITADIGQPDEINMEKISERMLASGASKAILIDLKEELASAGVKILQARAIYEGGYWNTTGIARHVTVKGLLRKMKELGINILVHGATGRGNDQVRFSLVANMLNPEVEVYAPWRDHHFIEAFGGRKEMIEYCHNKNIPITASLEKPYSTDSNLLGLTHEAGKLEYLDIPASFVEPVMGVLPVNACDKIEKFEVRFVKGIPEYINGEAVSFVDAFLKTNEIAGRNGIGIGIHAVENRFVGIKSRGVYESPALVLLSACYEFLLQQIIDRRARNFYESISKQLSEQIYQSYFYDLKSQMMLAALKPVIEISNGTIEVELYKGNVSFLKASETPNSLYDPEVASMESVGDFDHKDSTGFIKVLGVGARALNIKGQIKETF